MTNTGFTKFIRTAAGVGVNALLLPLAQVEGLVSIGETLITKPSDGIDYACELAENISRKPIYKLIEKIIGE